MAPWACGGCTAADVGSVCSCRQHLESLHTSVRCTGSTSVKTHCPVLSGLCAVLSPQNVDPSPAHLALLAVLHVGCCSSMEYQVLIQACWPNGLHRSCIPLAPQGPGLGFEARGFLLVCLRMFYSFVPNHMQFSLSLRLWCSAILK